MNQGEQKMRIKFLPSESDCYALRVRLTETCFFSLLFHAVVLCSNSRPISVWLLLFQRSISFSKGSSGSKGIWPWMAETLFISYVRRGNFDFFLPQLTVDIGHRLRIVVANMWMRFSWDTHSIASAVMWSRSIIFDVCAWNILFHTNVERMSLSFSHKTA